MTTLPTQVLSHARAGNPARAWRLFGRLGLGEVTDDTKVLTLKGRLLKDLAWRAEGDEAARLFGEASEAYLSAFELTADSYPLINAAALALFAGDGERSYELARQVLHLLDSNPDEGETPFWREATRAEAQLLLGDRAEAESALSAGIAEFPEAWEDQARTIEQFAAISEALGEGNDWLDPYRLPSSLHFSGMIGLDPDAAGLIDAIEAALDELRPGFVFGALAAGADLMIAEAAVSAGARLHVTLPGTVAEFRAISVEPFGRDWGARFDALIERAEDIHCVELINAGDAPPFALQAEFASLVAMGQAVRRAEVLSSHVHALTIVAKGEDERLPAALWSGSSRSLHRIEAERVSVGHQSGEKPKDAEVRRELMGLLRLVGLDEEAYRRLASAHGLRTVPASTGTAFAGSPSDCIRAAGSAAKEVEEAHGALKIAACAEEPIDEMIADRLDRMVQATDAGSFVADYHTAMIASVLAPGLHIEELGEVASLSGQVSLWSLNPKAG